jgi:hypothetical protein
MRFPTALCARLVWHRLLHPFSGERAPAIFHLSPLVKDFPADRQPENVDPESEWHVPKTCLHAAEEAGAPVVWLGGTEPLFHPAIGEVTSDLVESGRYVFLHTSGAGLRKRIHEFKPVDRLYLTLEIPIKDASVSPLGLDQATSFQTIVEVIRVARLSGFHVSAHFTVLADTSAGDIEARIGTLLRQRLDGLAISSGGACFAQKDAKVFKTVAAITELIRSDGWRRFSRLLESSYTPTAALQEHSATQVAEAGACEETACL